MHRSLNDAVSMSGERGAVASFEDEAVVRLAMIERTVARWKGTLSLYDAWFKTFVTTVAVIPRGSGSIIGRVQQGAQGSFCSSRFFAWHLFGRPRL